MLHILLRCSPYSLPSRFYFIILTIFAGLCICLQEKNTDHNAVIPKIKACILETLLRRHQILFK